MGPVAGTVSEVVPITGRTLDGGFVNSAVNIIPADGKLAALQHYSQATRWPAIIQNDLWRSFCTVVPHRHFSVLQGTAGN